MRVSISPFWAYDL
jgi:hypothetical protein